MEDVKLPVKFYSKIKDYVILMNDRDVVYQGNKMIEVKPTTKIKFVNGQYVCIERYIYDFLIESKQFKKKTLMLEPVSVKAVHAPSLQLTEDMLMKLTVDELEVIGKPLGIIIEEDSEKKDIVASIVKKQKGETVIEKVTGAIKGIVTSAMPKTEDNNSVHPSIQVEPPTL